MRNYKTYYKNFIDLDKEEAWINQVGSEGWKLVKVTSGLAFHFERCEPGEYIVRGYCLSQEEEKDKKKRADMIELLEDSGAKVVSQKWLQIPEIEYFIRRADLGTFEIDTDLDSKIAQYKSRKNMFFEYGIIFISIGIIFSFNKDNFMRILAIIEIVCGLSFYIPIPNYNKIIRTYEEERGIHE